jgi:hypothetical protein
MTSSLRRGFSVCIVDVKFPAHYVIVLNIFAKPLAFLNPCEFSGTTKNRKKPINFPLQRREA